MVEKSCSTLDKIEAARDKLWNSNPAATMNINLAQPIKHDQLF
jgi:hypothetical protein